MNNQSQPRSTRYKTKLAQWAIAGFIGALIGMPLQALWNFLRRPHASPYIAVVVSEKSVDFPIPGDFLRGFQEASAGSPTYIAARDGMQVDIRTVEDLGSVDEAARIANELVQDRNCILVIGNSNSTLTDTTLDIFLRSDDPPTYILPIATANELMIKAKTAGHGAVLRMLPDNSAQAAVIQRIAKRLAPNYRVAIYGDQENPFYSLNLSRDIASRIRQTGGRVVIEEMIGPTNSIYQSREAWRYPQSAPEVLVFAGVAHHGLLLIDQLATLKVSAPIVFTDGCMVGALRENTPRIPNRAFVLSPVAASQKAANQMPTFEPIGRDAYALARLILTSCNPSSRSSVRGYVSRHKEKIQLTSGHAGEYRFNEEGNNIGMMWRVYEVTNGSLKLFTDY